MPETKKCPFCAEEVMAETNVCKHCGSEIGDVHSDSEEGKFNKVTMALLLVFAILASVGIPFGITRIEEEFIPFLRPSTSTSDPTLTSFSIPTITPTLTPTITPTQTQSLAFNTSFEDMQLKMESWTDTKFEYVYNLGDIQLYGGKDYTTGLMIYLLKTPDGAAAGFMIKIIDSELIDTEKATLTLLQIIDYYSSSTATDWLQENWPKKPEDSRKTIFQTDTGEIIFLFSKDEDSDYVLMALDIQFAYLLTEQP